MLCLIAGFVLVVGCKSSPPANVKHVSLQIFEVIDCTPKMVPMTLKGKTEKYCLADKPIIDETDVRGAQALHGDTGEVRLALYMTLQAGDRMKETTARIDGQREGGSSPGKLAMVIDGALIEAATVHGVISDSIVVDGAFSWDEAVQIARSLTGRG